MQMVRRLVICSLSVTALSLCGCSESAPQTSDLGLPHWGISKDGLAIGVGVEHDSDGVPTRITTFIRNASDQKKEVVVGDSWSGVWLRYQLRPLTEAWNRGTIEIHYPPQTEKKTHVPVTITIALEPDEIRVLDDRSEKLGQVLAPGTYSLSALFSSQPPVALHKPVEDHEPTIALSSKPVELRF